MGYRCVAVLWVKNRDATLSRDAAGVLEAGLRVSGRELWCAVASKVHCGSRAAAKLQWKGDGKVM